MGVIDRKSFRSTFLSITAVATLLVVTLIASPGKAQVVVIPPMTFNVDTTVDDGILIACTPAPNDCSLRGAITRVNARATGPGDTINVPAGTYTTTIPGIENANSGGDFDISKAVTITGAGASSTIIDGNGATISDRVFHVTTAVAVTFSGITIQNGMPIQTGGGIYTLGAVTLINSTVSGNTAGWHYGGIFAGGTVTLTNSTISGNTAAAFDIGGIRAGGAVTMTNSTLSGNTAAGNYGGIYAWAGMTVIDSTIYGNSASLYGGFFLRTGTATFSNSIIANNVTGDCSYNGALPVISDYTIDSDGSCGLVGVGDISASATITPSLGALANNGGTTFTHALLAGSPAIDTGVCVNATDQRGIIRPQGVACDIGAYEADFMLLTVAVTGGGSVSGGTAINCPTPLCSELYWPGTLVTLIATPTAGNYFTGWGGACAGFGMATTCTVTMNAAQTVTANFVPNTLAVTVTGTGTVISDIPGTGVGISCNPTCADNYNVGAVVTLTATPGAGQYFTGWGGACAGATPTCVVTMSAAQNVTAAFGAQDSLSVIIVGSGDVTSDVGVINCIDNAGSCSDIFIPGTVVTLTATPSAGYAFTGWTGACTGTGACVVTMAGATSVTAMFELSGCTDPTATNYNPLAVVDDGSCIFSSNSIAITVDVTDGQGGKATKTLKLTPQ